MDSIKYSKFKYFELLGLGIVYFIIIFNLIFLKDSLIAAFSAFFGITYTFLAGKGNPKCYLFGIAGSGLYGWLAFTNALWGNLCLYMLYYIPMQIIGFIKWNQHLKEDKKEIIKNSLVRKERILISIITFILCAISIYILYQINDKSPIIDGLTTILSIVGMYLTVKRAIEQWIVWIVVNGLTAVMWINIALSGENVYSTVLMWTVYFVLALYFYKEWKKEVV